MYLALVSLGYTEKSSARAGGSYGFGKAGVIRGSAIRTVIAYSCFREREDDPGVTRRLLGMTYWGQHDIDGTNYTGFARYGKLACDGTVKPFENSDADAIADSLGLRQRDPRQPEDLGSTFLVLEPTVRPTDLLRAVERSWWPALADRLFEVTVRTPDGVKSPRPLKDEVLRTFVRAYEVATVPRDNPKPDERKLTLGPIEMKGRRVDHPGDLALIVDLQGWSYADQIGTPDDEGSRVDHRSLIALMRGPRMVVEYLDVGQSYPYVRGVFIASEEIDEELRRTEPKSHDAWLTESDEGALDVESATIARAVIKRIKANAAQFRSLHRPPVPPPEDVHLPLFNSVMRSVMSGAGAGWKPPIHDTRPVAIRISHEPEALGLGLVRLRGSATISLSEHFEGDTGTIEVSLYYRFIEDERVGAYANLIVEHRGPFRKVEGAAGRFIGSLTRAEEARFDFVSEPYSAEWSGRLIVNGHPLRQRNGGGV